MINNPLKIIHKYKNNNRRIQYIQYIFIGSFVEDEIMSILDIIKKKTFFDTINILSKQKLSKLESYYGIYWYKSFFNRYHLLEQINNITKNNNNKKIIEAKMGKEWMTLHLSISINKTTQYSFAANYYDYLVARNKIKSHVRKNEMDFRTNKEIKMTGGMIEEDIDIVLPTMKIDDEEQDVVTEEDMDDEVVEDFNLDELTKLYSMDVVENDKHVKETSRLISDAVNDKKFIKQSSLTEVNETNIVDDMTYDIRLEDVFEKIYIKEEFIFMDDNIKTIRNKISISIPISNKFGEDIKLLPEYQYIWSEYSFNNSIDYVMIGQKWIRKNELVKIDIKPNENLNVYENLRNNLSYLKDSFGIKIKREDDENYILRDYMDYIEFNELYMMDIMNDFGLNYMTESDKKKNIYEVYVNIYYPLISFDRFENILMLLNNTNNKELELNIINYNTIRNDMRIEKEIYTIIEETRLKSSLYKKFQEISFLPTYIIQSIIHINLNNKNNMTGTISLEKYNLYKIFDNYIVSEKYPFIQYMTSDSMIAYKFYTKNQNSSNIDILSKWFENSAYGISFKIKVDNIEDKYLSIDISETGRLQYKITWKEEDKATIEDIRKSYQYVFDLLLKINSENKKIKFILPDESLFKYAFINTIQKFIIPGAIKDTIINHNDLSDFCRFFYTYISLVIEPKKRLAYNAKTDIIYSKYGTYLRYKRISNYENKTKMHLRILYFLRNFDISTKELIDEISKQFNITSEAAVSELDTIRVKYGNILNRTKKNLRKLKSMPKSKPPGIGIDIQGRKVDNYKIRITGARSKEQLEEIVEFIKVLMFLYIETYLNKNPKYQKIKTILTKLNKIAKRRNKVNDFVNYNDTNDIKVRQITELDKKRLGFKPEEGQSQWSRSCQNSGTDKKRRPLIVSNDNIKDLIKKGYKLNPVTKSYEKKVVITLNGKKKEIIAKTIILPSEDGAINYFTCDPDENSEHAYIGFLSKSNNPNDLCMPCCFKKDQADTINKKKKNYYMKCLGQKIKEDTDIVDIGLGDKLYILQDTNKIQDGRFIFLPKYLNQFFNIIWKHDHIIKNHYLIKSNSGYFFKYTVKNSINYFIAAIGHIYNMTIEQVKESAINILTNDTNDMIFTSLNNGDIRTIFKDRTSFINYIKTSTYIEYDIMGELLAHPNTISKKGIIYYIFDKKIKIIKKNLEKDEYVENYYLQCLNTENYIYINDDKDIVILIKDGKYFFPIYRVRKNATDKNVFLQKKYNKTEKEVKSIIEELTQYYRMSCIDNFIYKVNNKFNITAKLLNSFNINIKKQVIDNRNKVRYVILDNGIILPTTPSGSLQNIQIINIHDIKQSMLLDLPNTISLLKVFNKMIQSKLTDGVKFDYIPKLLYYNNTRKAQQIEYNVTTIFLINGMSIPIKHVYMKEIQFKKYGLNHIFQPIEEMIDIEIDKNENTIFDTRSTNIRNRMYRDEAYNLFRLELSLYLSNNKQIKNTIIGIVRNDNINKKNKKIELIKLLLQLIESKTKNTQFIEIIKELPDLKNYNEISNVREYCKINKAKEKCTNNLHCKFINNNCIFVMYKNDIVININRVAEEMIIDGIKFKEIIMEDMYYVSDIVNFNIYSDRPNQKIIKTSNFNIKKILSDLFGKDSIPSIGRRKILRNEVEIEDNYPELVEIGKQLTQVIKPNKNSIIRAYVNCYYWLHNNLYDNESRNLGYFSELQDTLTNLFKANIIDYINNLDDMNEYKDKLKQFRKNNYNTDGIMELTMFSYMFPYSIVVYDNYNNVKHIFSNGKVEFNTKTIGKYTSESAHSNTIYLKFNYENNNTIPTIISSIYYL